MNSLSKDILRPRLACFAIPWVLLLTALLVHPATARAQDPLVSVPRYTHPGAGQVFYFVLTDRFWNGSEANDSGGIAGGPDASGFDPTRISHFHGGDLLGLTSKLDYVKGLGATAIWITPPFANMPMSHGSAGYHGYWIEDFTRIDPHLGSEADFRSFVDRAHALGIKVYLDIVVNHTADVIRFKGGSTAYVPMSVAPYRDAAGHPFDPRALAFNGVDPEPAFPALSADTSFPHTPEVAPANAHAKAPEWLNDVTLYHNRGESSFRGESSTFGDFAGLDDVFTEHPRVVRGFIDVYASWIEKYGIDGYRIDTVKHVNIEFWQAFAPAIRARARAAGRPDFFLFGEVSNGNQDVPLMSEFSTRGTLDAVLDFGLYNDARDYVSRGHGASRIEEMFGEDDLYTHHDGDVHNATTFVSNHDDGRFGYFLEQDNPGAGPQLLERLDLLGQALLLTARGQPVVYYGDEQGMAGLGDDMGAREDMFASRSPRFMDLPLIGTTRTGRDDKFDPAHPLYRAIRALSLMREAHPGLSRGAMVVRSGAGPSVLAFSRIERSEKLEYVVALNNDRTETVDASLPTFQPAGARLRLLFDSEHPEGAPAQDLAAGHSGRVRLSLAPLQCQVWQAEAPLGKPPSPPTVALTEPAAGATLAFWEREQDEQRLASRQELRAEVSGGDGFAEVTFAMARASRPGQFELVGTSDHAPYRVFWRPPADLADGDTLTFIATVDDLRGARSSSSVAGIHVAPSGITFGIRGARVPAFTRLPVAPAKARAGDALTLTAQASGTEPLDYHWLRDGEAIPGADGPVLSLRAVTPADSGSYTAVVHNREGTAISRDTVLRVAP